MAYYNPYMQQSNAFNNQFIGQGMQQNIPQMSNVTNLPRQEQFNQQPVYNQPIGLQGKTVDSLDVVKATDIPLDGSISYFPIADGSMIVTKKLQTDGTSKTIIYRPVEENEVKTEAKYLTVDEFNEKIKKINNNDIKDELKALKKQIKNLQEDFEDLKDRKD